VIFKNIIRHLKRSDVNSNLETDHSVAIKSTAEEMLLELSLYGNPKLIRMQSGWWCFIEAFGSDVGSQLTVGSEINHRQPSNAISECLDRVQASGLQKHPQR
jgi:hypothetical protein